MYAAAIISAPLPSGTVTSIYSMSTSTKPKVVHLAQSCEHLEVRHIHGYVAVRPRGSKGTAGWLYLRKHSKTQLFIGNLPQPHWFARGQSSKLTASEDIQTRIKSVIKFMLPSAETVGEVFSTGNGRIAARIVMKDGESGVDKVLEQPGEYLDVEWERLVEGVDRGGGIVREGVVQRWLREYEEERDEGRVRRWSEAAMKAFEVRERARKEEKERLRREGGLVDEQGFTLVTSGAKQIKAAEATKLRKKGKKTRSLLGLEKGIEKEGFYRWQREKKSAVKELQNKFKDDQKRIKAIESLKEPGKRTDEVVGQSGTRGKRNDDQSVGREAMAD